MNKLFSKFGTLLLGVSLAFAGGIAALGAKKSIPVHAETATVTFTMAGFGEVTVTGYQNSAVSGSGVKSTGGTLAASSYGYVGSSGQVRGNQTNVAGANPSSVTNCNWHLFNTAPTSGAIKSIVVRAAAGSGTGYGFKGTLSVALGTASMGATTTGGTAVSPTQTGDFVDTFTFSNLDSSASYTYFKLFSAAKFTSATVTGITVVVTYEDSGIEVDTLTGISVTSPKTSYKAGDEFVKPSVTASYSVSGNKDVSSDAVFSGYDLNTPGNQSVNVSYTDPDDAVAETSYSIYVAEADLPLDSLYAADFTGQTSYSYESNHEIELNGNTWVASTSQVQDSVFYLGTNDKNSANGILNDNEEFAAVVTALSSADTTYSNNVGTAHAYVLLLNTSYNNVGAIRFTWAGGNNAFQIYIFGDTGSGFIELAHADYATSGATLAGSMTWMASEATNISKFAVVARPGTASSTAKDKTLRVATFEVYEAAAPEYTAAQFSQELLDETDAVCALVSQKTFEQMKSALTSIWSTLAGVDKYGSLGSAELEILSTAERDEGGTVVEQAMARYDRLTGKYSLTNFITGRTPMVGSTAGLNNNTPTNTSASTIIIVVVALTSITSIGVLLVIKRKRSLVK